MEKRDLITIAVSCLIGAGSFTALYKLEMAKANDPHFLVGHWRRQVDELPQDQYGTAVTNAYSNFVAAADRFAGAKTDESAWNMFVANKRVFNLLFLGSRTSEQIHPLRESYVRATTQIVADLQQFRSGSPQIGYLSDVLHGRTGIASNAVRTSQLDIGELERQVRNNLRIVNSDSRLLPAAYR